MRLNAAVRQEIIRNAMKVLNERAAALLKHEMALEAECYVAALPLALRQAIETIRSLDTRRPWFHIRSNVGYNVAGQHVVFTSEHGRSVPDGYHYSSSERMGSPITLEKHKHLVEKVRAWQADKLQFDKDTATADRTLKAMLKHVGSTETLFKVWPEGKKFYSTPPLTPVVKTGVPAVQIEALNKMIGLVA